MHKIFLSIVSMIFTGFLMKSHKKLQEQSDTKEELYRRRRAEYEALRASARPIIEYEALRASARPIIAKLDAISTPRDGEKWMASIGTVQQMRDALRPKRAVDVCDAMAMAPGSFS